MSMESNESIEKRSTRATVNQPGTRYHITVVATDEAGYRSSLWDPLGSITTNGKKVELSAAIQTSEWRRPQFCTEKMKHGLEAAIKASPERIPAWAGKICTREVEYKNDSDLATDE
ncbi:hypothetical protein PVAG01_10528 [Phlyctema vagabunda]|uniref:Uncharacterized protein n=1 Tax=Phlyctema vagabunda TaxID=108571 RepID=A0ABR4P2I4_9HELO